MRLDERDHRSLVLWAAGHAAATVRVAAHAANYALTAAVYPDAFRSTFGR